MLFTAAARHSVLCIACRFLDSEWYVIGYVADHLWRAGTRPTRNATQVSTQLCCESFVPIRMLLCRCYSSLPSIPPTLARCLARQADAPAPQLIASCAPHQPPDELSKDELLIELLHQSKLSHALPFVIGFSHSTHLRYDNMQQRFPNPYEESKWSNNAGW